MVTIVLTRVHPTCTHWLLEDVLTRIRPCESLGLGQSDFSAPPVSVLVRVQLEEQHGVNSQGHHSTH